MKTLSIYDHDLHNSLNTSKLHVSLSTDIHCMLGALIIENCVSYCIACMLSYCVEMDLAHT